MTEKIVGTPAAAVPLAGVDPTVALASTLQASATTAALIGSGMSRAAGVPTGWDVTLDLVRRYMQAAGISQDEDPQTWWAETIGAEPRYDQVLKAVAPTDAVRRQVLRRYFERDEFGVPFSPTPGHHALARLAAQNRVPVILTTNFDRLTEQALQSAGVAAQVLTHPSAVRGMTPLPHAGVTLVKLHGDYAGGPLLNSPEELGKYSGPWNRLLNRVFDEYGLVVVGWSGEYDSALAEAMNKSVGRRYAWYWTTYKADLTGAGRQLVNRRRAHVIDTHGADSFLTDLVSRVDALDQVALRAQTARPTVAHRAPSYGACPSGWDSNPLVHARAVVAFGPVSHEEAGRIDGRVRRDLVNRLQQSTITTTSATLNSEHTPAATVATQQTGNAVQLPEVPWTWDAAGDFQSTAVATYGLGGSGGPGTSVLANVFCPPVSGTNDAVLTLDLGLSYVDGVTISSLAKLFRRALVTLGQELLPVVAELAPTPAELRRVELHWAAPGSDNNINRPVPSANAVHLDVFGDVAHVRTGPKGYAEIPPLGTPLPDAAIGIVLRALETVMLDSGHLDPDRGLAQIRAELEAQPSA